MAKQAISVTLAPEHLGWLRARAQAIGSRSVSQVLDDLVSEARVAGRRAPVRSAVGMVAINPEDPELLQADEAMRALFAVSLARASGARSVRSGGTPRRG